jgi:nucleotide-binding universal stress UspA family protein
MYDTILVPLDGSARAERILRYVEELAFTRQSKVVFLQVIDPAASMVAAYDMIPYYDPEMARNLVAEANSYLHTLVNRFREEGLAVKCLVEQGPVVQTILQVAEREKADLIALASHGRTGLARVFYGSVAAGILNQTDRPLLIVRADKSP